MRDVPDPPADEVAETDVAPATADNRHRGRTVAAAILGVFAVLVLSVTIVAAWAEATVLRPEPVADLVGDALAEPEVQAALATYLTDQITSAVDLESVVTNVLPNTLDRFASTIAAATQSALERRLTNVLANPDVQEVITRSVERAHTVAMRLLEGDGLVDGITVADGEVSVNLLPLVGRGLTALQSLGLLQDVDVPELARDGDPQEQLAALSDALGRELPPGLAQLVVYRSESVARAQESVQSAQRLLALAQRGLWVLVALSVVLVAATILVAARRWRATLVLGVGTAATMVVLRSAVREVVDDAPGLVSRPGAKAATEAILRGASTSLLRLAGVVLLVAIATVVLTLLRTRWRREDIVLVAAVALGAATVAAIGVSIVGVVLGIVVGIAVPFVARWVVPPPTTGPA
jgi:hypothetical protein